MQNTSKSVRSTKRVPTLQEVVQKINKRQKRRAQHPNNYYQAIYWMPPIVHCNNSSTDASTEVSDSSDTDMEVAVEALTTYFKKCTDHDEHARQELVQAQVQKRRAHVNKRTHWRYYLAALEHNESIPPR